jgi:radical SAM superfamily enzyme YgiQ (UPF0313 family)
MKILFSTAPLHKEIWGDLAEVGSLLPPLGLCYLAAVTRELGHETAILDCYAEKIDYSLAVERIINENPDIVGISSTTQEIGAASLLARELKKKKPALLVLIGGVHITSTPLETMKRYPDFDIGFIGEGEAAMAAFLKAYEKKEPLWSVSGLIFRCPTRMSAEMDNIPSQYYVSNEELVMTPRMGAISDLDTLPIPAFDLLPELATHYSPAITNYKRSPVMGLVSSRGCPGQCTFCDRSMFGNRIRMHSVGRIMEIIDLLMNKYGIREINFYDDTLVAQRSRVIELCNHLIENKVDLTWSCNARVNLVNPELLQLMAKAGCWQISYGIESGEQALLDSLKKGITLEQVERAVKWSKEVGMQIKAYYIIGLPGETRDSLRKTKESILGLPLDDICLEFFTPFPGTVLYDQIVAEGVPIPDWEDMNTLKLTYIPVGFEEKELRDAFKDIIKRFYLRPRIIYGYMKRFASPGKMILLARVFFDFIRSKH